MNYNKRPEVKKMDRLVDDITSYLTKMDAPLDQKLLLEDKVVEIMLTCKEIGRIQGLIEAPKIYHHN